MLNSALAAHLEWLGFLRPTGLVVSAPALVRAGALLPQHDIAGQRLLLACCDPAAPEGQPRLADFFQFAREVLGWSFVAQGYAGSAVADAPLPPELQVTLLEYGETLAPDLAVRERDPAPGAPPWQLLVLLLPPGQDLDQVAAGAGQLPASPHGRMERLLRQTGVGAGLLCNGTTLRLVSAPRGESSGWLDFRLAEMVQTAGRPLVAALRLLLSEQRLLALPRAERLAALLEESRKFQNEVSERLAEQVLHALYALVRGFQTAHAESNGTLLREVLRDDPDLVYRGLLTVVLRLVFLRYAEERDLLPADETFLRSYGLAALYERLREDAALYPDTMDQRFGAWAQVVMLFRMIYDGVEAGDLRLPRRHGVLFDPDRFPFLEGRTSSLPRQQQQRLVPPRVPDGVVLLALEKLLLLDGERISYRALDVEQLGSVYETMMGFRLETARGQSLAIRAAKRSGAPTTINLEELLQTPPAQRLRWLQSATERKVAEGVAKSVQAAQTIADLHAALLPLVDQAATPDLVPPGGLVLQPSAERRRSGSHYTPRALTEPIVRTTLAPLLERLHTADGRPPRPAQILELKLCDPAMGSGAFLVEACRQLAEALLAAWHAHAARPPLAAHDDELLLARRLVAQRCLYGVDKNPVAVDLAKVSLWLVTLAKEEPFTFVDHALRHGDSLVGLQQAQIERFHWQTGGAALQDDFYTSTIRSQVQQAAELRSQIRHATAAQSDVALHTLWGAAQDALSRVRLYGDLVLAAFFAGSKPKEREAQRLAYAEDVRAERSAAHQARLEEWRHADLPLVPFHWEIEFPEVFQRANAGFDAVMGNPPFAGSVAIVEANLNGYTEWLREIHPESGGKCDLVAHFFRRGFNLIRQEGALGLIATNTIAQGDTRNSGLRWICEHGGTIYRADRRLKWPGMAAVIVSVIHIAKGAALMPPMLDHRQVERITAFLFHTGEHSDPKPLQANRLKSFNGTKVDGVGFLFNDTDRAEVSTPIAEMHRLIAENPDNSKVIFPYIGGEEINTSPSHSHHRYVINFGERSEEECRTNWPDLMKIVDTKVKSLRLASAASSKSNYSSAAQIYWRFARHSKDLYAAIEGMHRVLACSRVSQHISFVFLSTGLVYSDATVIFPLTTYAAFCALQSHTHEIWARFFASSLGDGLRYTPSDCFETFPFPQGWEAHAGLEAAGQAYYEYRAALMVERNEGLTKTYNRFHDPYEQEGAIVRLRELHSAMDRAVLAAYGWDDLATECEFLLDYAIDEESWGSKKKPYRYRWPDAVRDEVLARLLELNAVRAAQEALAGMGKRKGKGRSKEGMRDMFEG
ncbi:Eco57I restriction-modification methylase domain-containing protein [Candidatus Viridilinea mediisalina]|uniref:site-specific DNA-methyltransferase (adenine-specific) n=1 Tax=Candidatus Viridilinea mediisalina TaxID=2024553 RepID=A0A2A6RLC9_9CHLR|nr:DNA methyltransferase [Candidatus Viridilinea mediisalina]PDW03689.1 hypothetical protein CJ255_07665 [Candidatus Viridilinea mediisalina]